jgi:hypothetical protein
MLNQNSPGVSRHAAAGLGVVCGLVTLGGFALGLALRHGDMLALSCLTAGLALSCYLWWTWAAEPVLRKGLNLIVLVSATATAGLALYSNLAYGVWIAGLPLSLGTVANGKMAEHYWLGPFTLAYAALNYAMLKRCRKEASPGAR